MATETRTPFNIKLSVEEKARLEEHRIALGLRSHAEVVRFWIATETKADWLDRVSIEPSRLSEHVMPALDARSVEARRQLDIVAIHADQAKKIAAEPGGRTIPGVQLGPTKREAGSMLKKPKK